MEAIILAGGLGTRLRNIVSDIPKAMASMNSNGRPFLTILMNFLLEQGVTHIVLSTGYMSTVIESYYGDSYKGVNIDYSVENTPLLTGGAVKKALYLCKDDDVFVFNGDTYFNVNLREMLEWHINMKADLSIAIKKLKNFDRYGTINIKNDRICCFNEKKYCQNGWINGGVYCIKKKLLSSFDGTKFSLDKDFIETFAVDMNVIAYKGSGYFIDIGIPEDYYRACKKFGR